MARPALELSVKPFERLSLRELHDLLRLRSEVFVVEQHCVFLEIDGKDPESVHLLGSASGALAACARWYPEGGRIALGRIVTAPWARGRGWGRRIVDRALREIGDREVEISAQARLEGFYSNLGFEPRGEPFLEDGILHLRMRRPGAPIIPATL